MLLSRNTNGIIMSATLCTLYEILGRCEGAYADNTLRGYKNDLEQFARWCKRRGDDWLPAEPQTLASFIDHESESKCVSTVKRSVAAIEFAHRMADLPSPTCHSQVRLALRRAARRKTARPKQVLGLTAELLDRIIAACPDTLSGCRDAALLSIGYDTLCRSSELAAIQVHDLSSDLTSIVVRRSKTDPAGQGRTAYLSGRSQQLVRKWLTASGLHEGPLFRGLHTAKLRSRPLDTSSVRRIIKRAAGRTLSELRAKALSGHSMRVGAAQDMMVAGLDTLTIMHAGGWRTIATLRRYVEHASAKHVDVRRWHLVEQLYSI